MKTNSTSLLCHALHRVGTALILTACLLLGLTACQEEEIVYVSHTEWTDYKIAAILPFNQTDGQHWKRTLEGAVDNMVYTQKSLDQGIRLHIEWYDEESIDIEATMHTLLQRPDIVAFIGPHFSGNVKKALETCHRTHVLDKPIFTMASSEELVRLYANQKSVSNLWSMAESDITQCELLLTRAKMEGGNKVALLAKDDLYGSTFINWFGFIAQELQLGIDRIYKYTDQNLPQQIQAIHNGPADCVLMALSTPQEAAAAMNESQRCGLKEKLNGHIYYSDVAFNPEVIQLASKENSNGCYGIAHSEDPSLGFSTLYKAMHGTTPIPGEAQYNDAIDLLTYALFDRMANSTPEENLNLALRRIVNGKVEVGSM